MVCTCFKGKPVFVYNLLNLKRTRWEGGVGSADLMGKALEPGKHTIAFEFTYDGPGPGKGGTGVLSVDGKELSRKTMEHSIPFIMAIDETFDIGCDTRTPVDDSYELPFHFTGKIDRLTYKLGPGGGPCCKDRGASQCAQLGKAVIRSLRTRSASSGVSMNGTSSRRFCLAGENQR